MKTRGKYYNSLRKYRIATGDYKNIFSYPSIHVSGSVKGMRKLFWGYDCDVVRCGNYIYKVN